VANLDSILFPCAPKAGFELATRLDGLRPLFACVIAWTDTAAIPGLSAAGASTELIPYTAPADAEVLVHGAARCINGVPSNPLGPPGPAIITRAALELGAIPHLIVNAGCRVLPDVDYVDLGAEPGGLISDGEAVPGASAIYEAGRALGRSLAAEHDYLVIGESVPGGTTTALALLLALGFAADGRVSSSLAGNAHALKSRVAHQALAHLDRDEVDHDPLAAVRTLGDPMQPAVAGLAAGALETDRPILLAGGTQMIAVLALMEQLAARGAAPPLRNIAVATTRWVVEDPTADAAGLMAEVGEHPLYCTALSFASSRHPTLRLYESNLVKEGVGAGGAAVAAALASNLSIAALAAGTEQIYESMQRDDSQGASLGTTTTGTTTIAPATR
jgi:uncharacterized protein (TIGR00303 family)